jgi:hypothetical protein
MNVNTACKFFIKCTIVTLLFAILLYVSDLNVEKLQLIFLTNFSGTSLFLVTGIFILNFYIVAARLCLYYRQFNINISYDESKSALIAGQISGVIPVFGPVLGQSLSLKKSSDISSTASTFIYFYERIMMAASGAVTSLIIAYFTMEHKLFFTVNNESSGVIEYIVILLITLSAIWFKGLNALEKSTLKKYLSIRNVIYALSGTLLSLCSWLLSALCFLICVYFSCKNYPVESIPYFNIFLMSIIVSFLSSLPLSVNGWGIREFSAITVFGLLTIPKEIALFSSLSVGVFSLFALFILFIIHYFKKNRKNFYTHKISDQKTTKFFKKPDKSGISKLTDERLIYWMGCAAAILIFFQAHFVFGKVTASINIADIFSICGLVIFLLNYPKFENKKFKIPYIKSFFLSASFMFLMAFCWGFYQFGFTGFSFFSKFIGFFILLGYFFIGTLFIEKVGIEKGFKTLLNFMSIVLVCIILFQVLEHILEVIGLIPYNYYHSSLSGYAGNRNAFAMQILCVIAMQLAIFSSRNNHDKAKAYWLLATLFSGVLFTYSRSAIITSIFVLIISRVLCFINNQNFRYICIRILVIVSAFFLLEHMLCFLIEQLNSWEPGYGIQLSARSMFKMQQYSPSSSDSQRLYTIMEGIKLWMQSPFLGIGLGGFLHHEIIKNNIPLVIHNTFLWFLTEFGIIGSSVFFLYGFVILKYLHRLKIKIKCKNWDIQDKLLLNLVLIFLLMGNAHEIFYQRIWWFLLGVAAINAQIFNEKCSQS